MPITIDGDGTITGVSVGGLPDGIVDADMLASNAVTTAKISDSQITEAKLASDPQKGLAKAWVYFDGTASDITSTANGYNVSTITDQGAGQYTVNFTTAFSNNNYAVTHGATFATSNGFSFYDNESTGSVDEIYFFCWRLCRPSARFLRNSWRLHSE